MPSTMPDFMHRRFGRIHLLRLGSRCRHQASKAGAARAMTAVANGGGNDSGGLARDPVAASCHPRTETQTAGRPAPTERNGGRLAGTRCRRSEIRRQRLGRTLFGTLALFSRSRRKHQIAPRPLQPAGSAAGSSAAPESALDRRSNDSFCHGGASRRAEEKGWQMTRRLRKTDRASVAEASRPRGGCRSSAGGTGAGSRIAPCCRCRGAARA